jgi:cyclic beta-1,2-glucan synthetase
VIDGFAPIARSRHDEARVQQWQAVKAGWLDALEGEGWDGRWYRRAFFDDGTPLGSQQNDECRIDLIAQAWSVMSGLAPIERQRRAMSSVEQHLADHETGLMRLLHPPLARSEPSAGYIQAYPPGVRENGGQYSHAAVWALMAHARLGHAEEAWRTFTWLSPAHRHEREGAAGPYELEPYVMAGDIYTQPPYGGRGGWSWYTGSAAWLYRASLESLCGLRIREGKAWFEPCLPPEWGHVWLTLRHGDKTLRFALCGLDEAPSVQAAIEGASVVVQPGQPIDLVHAREATLVIVDRVRTAGVSALADVRIGEAFHGEALRTGMAQEEPKVR